MKKAIILKINLKLILFFTKGELIKSDCKDIKVAQLFYQW